MFPSNSPNGECPLTGQPPLLLCLENSSLPVRCAPHVFAVFRQGHFAQQLPLVGLMGVDKQAPNSLPSDEHSDLQFEASDAECRLVSYDNCIGDLDKLEQNSVVIVKGRLCENIAFWQSIWASQWLLNVLCEPQGYCLPFVSFPVNKFFPNHKCVMFVSAEISKLLASGAIGEVLSTDLHVCNPLGVALNSSGKPTLILDLHYANQHLRPCKFKYEDVRTAADLFHKGDWFIKFDYSSTYHHLQIFPGHKFLF